MTFGIADNRNGNEMVSIFEIGHDLPCAGIGCRHVERANQENGSTMAPGSDG